MNRFMNPGLLGQPAQPFRQVSPLQALLGGGQEMMQQAMPQQAMQPAMNPRQNRFAGLLDALPDVMIGLGAGFASGNPGVTAEIFQQQLADKRQTRQLSQTANATKQWLQSQGMDDLLPLVDANMAQEALRMAMERRKQNDSGVYGTPIYGEDKDGNPVIGAMGKDGSFRTLDTGDFRISSGVDRVDAGTHFILLDKRSGQVVGTLPKQNYQESFDKGRGAEEGKAAGSSNASAQGDFDAAADALALIESIRNDPNRQRGTGGSSFFNRIPSTGGYDFQNKVDQAKSGAFLTAIQALRGLGALSNAEGSAATQAVTRLDTATSEAAFLEALADYEKIVRRGYDRAAARLGQTPPQGAATPAAPTNQSGRGGMGDDIDSLVEEYRSR